MIAPDMATMLSFVFTDAPISAPVLQGLLQPQIDKSFQRHHGRQRHLDLRHLPRLCHRQGGDRPRSPTLDDPRAETFAEALGDVLHELAMWTIKDGEGATKLVTVTVTGATSDKSAFRGSRSRSPTRRWSRPPLRARTPTGAASSWPSARRASRPTATSSPSASVSSCWPKQGERAPSYDEAATSAYMKNQELEIGVDIGLGVGYGDGLHLRPDAWLHRHQRQLPELTMAPSPSQISKAPLSTPGRHLQVAHDRLWVWRAAKPAIPSAPTPSIASIHPTAPMPTRASRGLRPLYRYNELEPVFRVTPLTSAGALAALDRAGWQCSSKSKVLAMETAGDAMGGEASTPGGSIRAIRTGSSARPDERLQSPIRWDPQSPSSRRWPARTAAILAYTEEGKPVAAVLATVSQWHRSSISMWWHDARRFAARAMAGPRWRRRSTGPRAKAPPIVRDPGAGRQWSGHRPLWLARLCAQAYDYHYRKPAHDEAQTSPSWSPARSSMPIGGC